MSYDDEKQRLAEFFSQVTPIVREKLRDEGYAIMNVDSQEWAIHYSLNSRDIDGSVALYFDLGFDGDGELDLPYLIVREGSFRGRIGFPATSSPLVVADVFLQRVLRVLHGIRCAPKPFPPNVGRGLLPVPGRQCQLHSALEYAETRA